MALYRQDPGYYGGGGDVTTGAGSFGADVPPKPPSPWGPLPNQPTNPTETTDTPWGGQTDPNYNPTYQPGEGYKPLKPNQYYDPNPGVPAPPGYYPDPDPKKTGLQGPGYAEQFWIDNQNKWFQPGQFDQYWNGKRGVIEAGPTKPGAVAGERGNWDNNAPSRSEDFYDQGGPTFAGYDQRGYERGTRSRNQNVTGEQMGNFLPGMSNKTGLELDYEGGAGRGLGGRSGDVFGRFFDPLASGSYSEDLLGGGAGLDEYYNRQADVGSERIRNMMAAKGLFGSGAAADEERQLFADLGADQAKNEADYNLRLAGQADENRLGRMGLAGDLAGGADEKEILGSKNQLDWAREATDAGFNRSREAREWAGQNDEFGLKRDAAEREWGDLLTDNEMDQTREQRAAREGADRERTTREREARSWADLLDKGTRADNDQTLGWIEAGGDMALKSDQERRAWIESGMKAAMTAQGAERDRYNDQFRNMLAQAEAKAELLGKGGAADKAIDGTTEAAMERISSILAAGANFANMTEQDRQRFAEDLGLVLKFLG